MNQFPCCVSTESFSSEDSEDFPQVYLFPGFQIIKAFSSKTFSPIRQFLSFRKYFNELFIGQICFFLRMTNALRFLFQLLKSKFVFLWIQFSKERIIHISNYFLLWLRHSYNVNFLNSQTYITNDLNRLNMLFRNNRNLILLLLLYDFYVICSSLQYYQDIVIFNPWLLVIFFYDVTTTRLLILFALKTTGLFFMWLFLFS